MVQITNPSKPNALVQVLISGRISSGAIAQGNQITVYGKFDGRGQFIAKSIHNDTTGADVVPTEIISCTITRAITALVLIFLIMVIVSGALTSLVALIVVVLIIILILKIVKKFWPYMLYGMLFR